jgi:hypothetical protein
MEALIDLGRELQYMSAEVLPPLSLSLYQICNCIGFPFSAKYVLDKI